MSTAYRIKLRCTDCGHTFRRTVESVDAADPPCPHCAKVPENIGLDVAAGKAPSVGGNPTVQAMDFTMSAVASDYGFTDLRTDAHEGETMTPKLPPQQQIIADAMFNPSLRKKALGSNGAALSGKLSSIAANAMAGGYKAPTHDPVALMQKGQQPGAKVKANYVVGDGVPRH